MTPVELAQEIRRRADPIINGGGRFITALAGAPGAGKSTLATDLMAALGTGARVVPMDGFHLANVELARLGRAHRKGAPDTFDSAGYVDLLKRLHSQAADEIIYAPEFRREIEEPIAGAIPIFPETQLLITEGNYLLLEEGHWQKVPTYLDEIWYVDVDDDLRIGRLADRHVQFGRTRDEAVAWVNNTDEPNARLIEQGKHRAHLVFRWDAE